MKIKKNLRKLLFTSALTGMLSLPFVPRVYDSNLGKAQAAEVTLAWDANSEKDLAGYKVYYNPLIGGKYNEGAGAWEDSSLVDIPLEYLVDPNNPMVKLTGLEDQPYFFVVTAYNEMGNESGYSNEVGYDTFLKGLTIAPSQAHQGEFVNPEGGEITPILEESGDNHMEIIGNGEFADVRFPLFSNLGNINSPLMLVSARNIYENAQPIDISLEDSLGHIATYRGLENNFEPDLNHLMVDLATPSSVEEGFNPNEVRYVHLVGPSDYDLEKIVLLHGGTKITGDFFEGVNAWDAGNYADFENLNGNLKNDISALASRTTRTDRYVELSNLNLDIDLSQKSEFLFMFNLSDTQYNSLPTTAIEFYIDGTNYTINKDELRPGFNKIKKPIESTGYAWAADLRLNHTTGFSTRTLFDKLDDLYIGALSK